MENQFIDFWHLYAPQAQYHNRYLACQRLWETKSEADRALIMKELEQRQTANPSLSNEKNPYFYLIDWQPPQADWLSYNPQTHSFGTVTKADAELHALNVHHYM